jgi:hypothetical protein
VPVQSSSASAMSGNGTGAATGGQPVPMSTPLAQQPAADSKDVKAVQPKLSASLAVVSDALRRTVSFATEVAKAESALRAIGKWHEAKTLARTVDYMRPAVEKECGAEAYADRTLGENIMKLQQLVLLAAGKDAAGIALDDFGDASFASADALRKLFKDHADMAKAKRELATANAVLQKQHATAPVHHSEPPAWYSQPPPWFQPQHAQPQTQQFQSNAQPQQRQQRRGRRTRPAATGGSGTGRGSGVTQQVAAQAPAPSGPAPPLGAQRS